MTTTMTATDADLVARAHDADLDALRLLVERHVHPVWRIASVASADPAAVEAAAVDGFTAGLIAAHRSPDPTQSLRTRLVAATRRAAAAATTPTRAATPPIDDPVVVAFCAMPEKSRTALWLTEVEGGTPEQVAPVLGLDRSAAAALAERAAGTLRNRVAADVAARAEADECRQALSKLPTHAAGKLTSAERAAVGEHVGSCGSCAVWLAAMVSPRPALRGLVAIPPAGLAAAIEARWVEHLEKERKGWLAPFTERAVGAAAAAVLAIGLGGVALLGDRDDDDRDRRAELAVPASADPDPEGGGDDGSDGNDADDESGPATPPTTGSAPGTGSGQTQAASPTAPPAGSGSGSGSERPRSIDDPVPDPTAPAVPNPPTEPPRPAPDEDSTQITVTALEGLVAIGVGECTGLAILEVRTGCVPVADGDPLSITIDLPGIDPIGV